MIFSTCVVSHTKAINNSQRLKLLEDMLQILPDNVELVTLPAGYLSCINKDEINNYCKKIADLSNKFDINIALGADCEDISEFGASSQYSLPFLAIQTSPNKPPRIWRQHFYTRSEVGEIHLSRIVESRTIVLNGKKVEIVACGDLFNPAVREDIIKRDIDLVVALIHGVSGPRIQNAMEHLARNGIHGFCSLHAKVKNAVKYAYISTCDGEFRNISKRESDYVIKGVNHIEINIWDA